MIASAVLLGLLAGPVHAGPNPSADAADLLVEASLSTAGPYGELWILRLTPNGDIFLRVHYALNPSGSLMAEFDVTDEHLASLRKAIESERFFELPEEISPEAVALHEPDFRLEITVGHRKHKVELYDPVQLKSDANARRFLTVWAELFKSVPLKPSW